MDQVRPELVPTSSYTEDEKHSGSYDPEKTQYEQRTTTTVTELEALDDGVPRNKGFFAKLWKIANKLDRYGVEARGIERVPESQRSNVRCPRPIGAIFG